MALAEMQYWQALGQPQNLFLAFAPIPVPGQAPTQPRSLDRIQPHLKDLLEQHQEPPNEELAIAAATAQQQGQAPKATKQVGAAE